MPGNIRTATFKNVILLISSIVISLAITLCYTEKAFADEPLPEASAETEAVDIQPEEGPPEVEYTEPEAEPPSEGSETEDTGQYAAVENDAVYIDTTSEETCGDAADEMTAAAYTQTEPEQAEVGEEAGRESGKAGNSDETAVEGKSADGTQVDNTVVAADDGKSAVTVQADSAGATADEGKDGDAVLTDSALVSTDDGESGDAVQVNSALVTADEEKSGDAVPTDSALNAAEEVTSTDLELSSDSVSKTE